MSRRSLSVASPGWRSLQEHVACEDVDKIFPHMLPISQSFNWACSSGLSSSASIIALCVHAIRITYTSQNVYSIIFTHTCSYYLSGVRCFCCSQPRAGILLITGLADPPLGVRRLSKSYHRHSIARRDYVAFMNQNFGTFLFFCLAMSCRFTNDSLSVPRHNYTMDTMFHLLSNPNE